MLGRGVRTLAVTPVRVAHRDSDFSILPHHPLLLLVTAHPLTSEAQPLTQAHSEKKMNKMFVA